MKKIKWKSKGPNEYACARVGCIDLYCLLVLTRNSKKIWFACVSINNGSSGTYYALIKNRYGPKRKSLSKAKDDAVRIACEVLLDCYTSLTAEMKNFDLFETNN